MSYVLMELTKVTDRVDTLENQLNDENEETKSVGAVNIEFTGEFIGNLSELLLVKALFRFIRFNTSSESRQYYSTSTS